MGVQCPLGGGRLAADQEQFVRGLPQQAGSETLAYVRRYHALTFFPVTPFCWRRKIGHRHPLPVDELLHACQLVAGAVHAPSHNKESAVAVVGGPCPTNRHGWAGLPVASVLVQEVALVSHLLRKT